MSIARTITQNVRLYMRCFFTWRIFDSNCLWPVKFDLSYGWSHIWQEYLSVEGLPSASHIDHKNIYIQYSKNWFLFITDRVRSTTEGYDFTCVCLLTGGREGEPWPGYPKVSTLGQSTYPPPPPPPAGQESIWSTLCFLRSCRRTFLFINLESLIFNLNAIDLNPQMTLYF